MGSGQCKGPQVRAIICSMSSKEASQSRVGRTWGRVIGDEVREVPGTGLCTSFSERWLHSGENQKPAHCFMQSKDMINLPIEGTPYAAVWGQTLKDKRKSRRPVRRLLHQSRREMMGAWISMGAVGVVRIGQILGVCFGKTSRNFLTVEKWRYRIKTESKMIPSFMG